jgi:hypothetical protein
MYLPTAPTDAPATAAAVLTTSALAIIVLTVMPPGLSPTAPAELAPRKFLCSF